MEWLMDKYSEIIESRGEVDFYSGGEGPQVKYLHRSPTFLWPGQEWVGGVISKHMSVDGDPLLTASDSGRI